MENNGFIKLWRSFIKWEWYDDINTKTLFLHCLLKANWEDKRWHGHLIEKGSFVTSLSKLSKETKLSVRQVRTSLDKLKMTGELTKETTENFTIITVNNWASYQGYDTLNDKPMTRQRQGDDKAMTTTKEYKERKENKEINNYIYNTSKKSVPTYMITTLPEQELATEEETESVKQMIEKIGDKA